MAPDWLVSLATACVALAFLSTAVAIGMLIIRPQKMAVMGIVWPVTALYWGPVALWTLWRFGTPPVSPAIMRAHQRQQERQKRRNEAQKQRARAASEAAGLVFDQYGVPRQKIARQDEEHGEQEQDGGGGESKPFSAQVAVAVTHCGAGCTLGDIIGEWLVYAFGWKLFGGTLYAEFLVDFPLAYLLGILFQYYTIAPMRGLGVKDGLIAAAKADTISIVAFEIGLFGWMALSKLVLFPQEDIASWNHWFMMQIGMIIGFFTSYPANWWLLKAGLKEKM